MSLPVYVSFEIPAGEYQVLARLAENLGVTLPTLYRQLGQHAVNEVHRKVATDTRPQLTPEIVQLMRRLAERNATRREIAAAIGVTRLETVSRWCRESGIPLNPGPVRARVLTADESSRFASMHNAGATQKMLAAEFVCSITLISKFIVELGLVPHTRGRTKGPA